MILKGSPDYLDMVACGHEGISYVTVNIPTHCPRRCPQCALSTWCSEGEEVVLLPEERNEAIVKAAEAGAQVLVIIGNGEPLWQPADGRPGFEELVRPVIERASLLGMGTIIFTTLSVSISREQMEILRDNNVSIFVSLHSLDAETYRKATGNGDLCTVLANIERLRAVFGSNEELNGREVTRLGVNTTVTRLNQGELAKIKEFVHTHGMQFICNPLMPTGLAGNDRVWEMLVGSEANYVEQARLATEYSDTHGQSSIRDGRCSYGYRGIAVDVDGTMMLCGYAHGPDGAMPNVKDMSVDELVEFHRQIKSCWKRCETEGCMHCITRADTKSQLEELVRRELERTS